MATRRVIIQGLELYCRIGVPESERSKPQRLLVDVRIELAIPFRKMDDAVERTVDYDRLTREITALAASRPRKLIETLAADINALALSQRGATAATTRIRKFILAETEFVAVETSDEKTPPKK